MENNTMSELVTMTAEDHKANLAQFTGCERPFYEPMFPRVLAISHFGMVANTICPIWAKVTLLFLLLHMITL